MSAAQLIRFADLIGRAALHERLQELVRQHRLPPVLLFTGPPGVGKRSCARALAAWLNCGEAPNAPDACGECPPCRHTAAGTFADLLVVQAGGKKEMGIDRARELRQFVSLEPVHGRQRIALIEEAERLTVPAQNALLKVLEEPPPRAAIWLTTSTPDALLPTVRSRCQRVAVPPLPAASVQELLVERHGMPPDAARELAEVSEGSVGRALALRDLLPAEERAAVLSAAQMLATRRYRDVLAFVEKLSQPEAKLQVKLEFFLAHSQAQARAAASPLARASAARAAQIVFHAWQVLRDSYPNRTLLLEAMALELAEEMRCLWTSP